MNSLANYVIGRRAEVSEDRPGERTAGPVRSLSAAELGLDDPAWADMWQAEQRYVLAQREELAAVSEAQLRYEIAEAAQDALDASSARLVAARTAVVLAGDKLTEAQARAFFDLPDWPYRP